MSKAALAKILEDLNTGYAKRYDPVRFAYIESLSAKINDRANSNLHASALKKAKQYRKDLSRARQQSKLLLDALVSEYSEHADTAFALFEQCEFHKLEQLDKRLRWQEKRKQNLGALCQLTNELTKLSDTVEENPEPSSFDELLKQQEDRVMSAAGVLEIEFKAQPKSQNELQSMKVFRQAIKHADIDKIISRALNECPENPGPHNPHMLAIKSLSRMHELSPKYLRRFAGYIEIMQWLDKNATKLANDKKSF